jgi:CheY-like chemotaxis protein
MANERHEERTAYKGMKSVLLIDDDPVQLSTREALLRRVGLQVAMATTAASALALMKSEQGRQIGVVVTDHLMPQTSGAEFVRELRRWNSAVPILVISGLPDAEAEYEGMDVTFRLKPCPPAELISLLCGFLKEAA